MTTAPSIEVISKAVEQSLSTNTIGFDILCGNKIFGNLKTIYTTQFNDINFREFSVLLPLLLLVLFMGIYPSFFSHFIHLSIENLFIVTFY